MKEEKDLNLGRFDFEGLNVLERAICFPLESSPQEMRMRYVPLDLDMILAMNFSSLMAKIMHL